MKKGCRWLMLAAVGSGLFQFSNCVPNLFQEFRDAALAGWGDYWAQATFDYLDSLNLTGTAQD